MKRSTLFFLISTLIAPLSASAGDRLFVQIPALTGPNSFIPAAVRKECGLETLLGEYVLAEIGKRDSTVQGITAPEQAGADQFVQLTILVVQGSGGGHWSGPKAMFLRAEMRKGGVSLGSTDLNRSMRGGGFTGTCGMLDRVAAALAKDVAKWVARGPTAAPAASGANPDQVAPPATSN